MPQQGALNVKRTLLSSAIAAVMFATCLAGTCFTSSQASAQPMAAEFRWCAAQLSMGSSLQGVMRSLVHRVPLYDMRIFATTLIVHRQTGGNIVGVLERLAQVIRDRLSYKRQLRATLAAGRMSAGFVAMVTPAVFVYYFFFRPEYVNTMLQAPLGRSLIILTVVLEIVGLAWTARLLRPNF